MALVLKKAVLSKNTSLLKCMKGRHFLSAANKKNPAITTAACPRRRFREKSLLCGWAWKIETAKRPKCSRSRCKTGKTLRARCCFSCPELASRGRAAQRPPPRHHSLPARVSSIPLAFSSNVLPLTPARNVSTLSDRRSAAAERAMCPSLKPYPVPVLPKTAIVQSQRTYTCKCGCGCPFPCGPFGCCKGCGCLPPPCNTPPRCIQYMTGYYYYPYGFWFCGPYHVTGLCCPVSGSCPCGPCGCGCGKCCACCVCPDISGAALAAGIPSLAPEPSPRRIFQTQLGKGYPIQEKEAKDTTSRLSMNKFFPFSTAVTPSIQKRPSAKKIIQGAFTDRRGFKAPDKRWGPTRSYSTVSDYNKVYVRFDKRGPYSATMKPRKIPTAKERDQPNIYPGQFHLGSIPKYKNPYPNHKSLDENQNAIKVDS